MSTTLDERVPRWTCFHCDETFTTAGSARDHFGASQAAEPGCMIRVSLGGERGLLMALRKAEACIARYMEEDSEVMRYARALQSRHVDGLNDAEEAGYARGLRDGRQESHVPPIPEGFAPVPCAIAMHGTQAGWLFVPHVDGKWVSAALLQPFSQKIIEHWRAGP